MKWILWAVLLLLQNATFTWVSRARNSGSLPYHAAAALGSNCTWILSQFILVDSMVKILREGAWWEAVGVVVFYTTFTMIGSVSMHWISMNYLEKGRRRVGAV
jgi:hypothetical protein